MSEDRAVHPDADRWNGWSWREPSRGEHFRRCSYCGSVHPEDLAAEPSWQTHWADMKYGWPHKFYVNIVNREPEQKFVVGSSYGGLPDSPLQPGEIAWADLTGEHLVIVERDYGRMDGRGSMPRAVRFGTRPSHYGKFYSTHLGDPAVAPAAKERIEDMSGIRFVFEGDRVRWSRAVTDGGVPGG